jgi:MFS family permease
LVLLVAPFVIWVPDQPVKEVHPHTGFWISPRQFPDFGWTLLSRVLVNLGNAFGTTLLFYFLEDYLKVADAEAAILELTLVYMVFVVVASLVMGRLSDDTGRRKVFVWIASGLQGIAALMLAFVPQFGVAMAGAALLGTGYGCFLAVDQALATQVLPDPATRGKDLGIMNIATAVPQAIAPLLGAMVVAYLGGFGALYIVAGITSLIGAAAVLPIKQVK